jgi:hypothetical protein
MYYIYVSIEDLVLPTAHTYTLQSHEADGRKNMIQVNTLYM